METIVLDGKSLTPDIIRRIQDLNQKVELSDDAWEKVDKSRNVIDKILTG